ncbi:hypothetical protein BDW42DRAFT_194896 [Aspergillus taichungensis]|uniref:Ecp2 effector protein-like domain-containing protein n=1 Tax=Aspergillus taichungensis TaxID=482145 RepID=A0A2J5HR47_9EURO|nr:hypothetical protein BDW42DRAFT_194896 [Aspergillus taichungensis]
MRFSIAASIACLLALTQAAPTTNELVARKSVNDCGDSTFIDQGSEGSPDITDCQHIVENIKGGGTWKVSQIGAQYQLVEFGTCAFGAEGNAANTAYVGNQDIMDIINESIRKFGRPDGKVGAKGTVDCQSDRGAMGVGRLDWGIYKV